VTFSSVHPNPVIKQGAGLGANSRARPLHKLSARRVEKEARPGRYGDGGGLYLLVSTSGGRSWVFRYSYTGRERDLGLGAVRDVSLARARDKAAAFRAALADGLDPAQTRERKQAPTFKEAAAGLCCATRLKGEVPLFPDRLMPRAA
jgi:hypothetical protein